jgi:hypothetical protein
MKIFGEIFSHHGDVSVQQFIYRGTTVATGTGEVSKAVATENHSSDERLLSSAHC